jgi:hypothetical protein
VKLLIDHCRSMLGQQGDGDCAQNGINRLYGCYINPYGQKYRIFVSEYTETQYTFQITKGNDPIIALISPKVKKRMKLAQKDLACCKKAGRLSCWERDAEDKDITMLSMDDIDNY